MDQGKQLIKLPSEVLCETCRTNKNDYYTVLPHCSECLLIIELKKYERSILPGYN